MQATCPTETPVGTPTATPSSSPRATPRQLHDTAATSGYAPSSAPSSTTSSRSRDGVGGSKEAVLKANTSPHPVPIYHYIGHNTDPGGDGAGDDDGEGHELVVRGEVLGEGGLDHRPTTGRRLSPTIVSPSLSPPPPGPSPPTQVPLSVTVLSSAPAQPITLRAAVDAHAHSGPVTGPAADARTTDRARAADRDAGAGPGSTPAFAASRGDGGGEGGEVGTLVIHIRPRARIQNPTRRYLRLTLAATTTTATKRADEGASAGLWLLVPPTPPLSKPGAMGRGACVVGMVQRGSGGGSVFKFWPK